MGFAYKEDSQDQSDEHKYESPFTQLDMRFFCLFLLRIERAFDVLEILLRVWWRNNTFLHICNMAVSCLQEWRTVVVFVVVMLLFVVC